MAQKTQNCGEIDMVPESVPVRGEVLKNTVPNTAQTKVAGKNTMVRTAIVFIALMSAC
jgi:hypothetical protein